MGTRMIRRPDSFHISHKSTQSLHTTQHSSQTSFIFRQSIVHIPTSFHTDHHTHCTQLNIVCRPALFHREYSPQTRFNSHISAYSLHTTQHSSLTNLILHRVYPVDLLHFTQINILIAHNLAQSIDQPYFTKSIVRILASFHTNQHTHCTQLNIDHILVFSYSTTNYSN